MVEVLAVGFEVGPGLAGHCVAAGRVGAFRCASLKHPSQAGRGGTSPIDSSEQEADNRLVSCEFVGCWADGDAATSPLARL